MTGGDLSGYIIRGGDVGRARLSVLAGVLEPTTEALFDRFEPLAGALIVDAGCGGGDVSMALARRVGPDGHVVAFDLDAGKLAAGRRNAKALGIDAITFAQASVLERWPVGNAALVYMRFVLTHLAEPERALSRAMQALAPGGLLVVEDIDFAGHFCHPPCPAFDRFVELYVAAAARRGADAHIGRRLHDLLEGVGFSDVATSLLQPYGRSGDVKRMASLTFAAIAETVVTAGLTNAVEVESIQRELEAHAASPDTTQSMPRIFQAWGRRPVG